MQRRTNLDIKASINATREGFEESFCSGDLYNKQTQDSVHLEQIMSFLPIKDGIKVLDLGAGSGYLSFPIAKRNPSLQTYTELYITEKVNDILFVKN